MSDRIELLTCPHGHTAIGASTEHDRGGTRLTDGKCCGAWTVTKSWSADLARVRASIDELINAPRDAARDAAEVVIDDTADDVRLLRTSLGEWGVGQVSADFDLLGEAIGDKVATAWCADEAAARRLFAELRGKIVCFGCTVEVTEGESEPATEDGDRYCPKCGAEAREGFKVASFRCVDPGRPSPSGGSIDPCGWRGKGAEVVIDDDLILCPDCNGNAEEVDEAATAGEGTGKDVVIEDGETHCPKCQGEAQEVDDGTPSLRDVVEGNEDHGCGS